MLYLRAGDLVYEQGTTQDHCGFASGMGIYYIARGIVTSVLVPGSNIRKSRKEREDQYIKELHRIRKDQLSTLISRNRLKLHDQNGHGEDGEDGEDYEDDEDETDRNNNDNNTYSDVRRSYKHQNKIKNIEKEEVQD